ncbi:MAG: hypothetical protein R2720_01795 [Candidatus Nanopelagicales bacterium]
MGRIAAIGESIRMRGLELAGVLLLPGDDPEEVRDSWKRLPGDVEVVILTPEAADALAPVPPQPLTAVMPA